MSDSQAPGPLDDALAYVIHRSTRFLRMHLLRMFRGYGYDVTPEQWFILYRLWEKDGQSQIELSDKIFQDRPNITRIVDALQKRQFVERRADPNDRRKHLIFLTAGSREMLATVMPDLPALRRHIFRGIDERDLQVTRRVLLQLEKNIADEL